MKLRKIISGGQTGADRGALDAAIREGIEHGGWCPKGRRSESGPIPGRYQLQETDSRQYRERTRRNVMFADATLLVTQPPFLTSGSRLTLQVAQWHGKPEWWTMMRTHMDWQQEAKAIAHWCTMNDVGVLNVAGTRESKAPGIQQDTEALVCLVIRQLRGQP